MSRYETYKESDFVGIGKVPEHWEVKRLKHLGDAIIGLTYSPNDITENEEGILVLRSSNIQDGFIAYDDCVYVDKEVNPNLFTRKGDILICARNGSAHLVGKNICIDEKSEGHTFGAFMVVFRGKFWRYLSYFFNSPIFTSQTGMFSTTTINQLTSQTLNNLRIAYPSDSIEQENICNYLDDQTQKIDRLITNKKAQAEKLKELRQIEINNAVTKGLNPNAEMKDSGIEWLGNIPKHWEVKRLKNILLNINSGDGISNDELVEDGEIEVYGGNGVMGYTDKYNSDGKVIIIGRVGAKCGVVYLVDKKIWISDNALQSRTYQDYEFVYYLIDAMNLNNYANQNAQPLITGGILKGLYAALPPKKEQTEIASFLQKRTTAIDQLIKNIEAQIEKLQELRKIKIYEAVTGKIKVNAYAETTA
jgi:type I restriction enzyme S subunit